MRHFFYTFVSHFDLEKYHRKVGELEFFRARVEIEVSGREQVLFQWIDRLNSPSDLRTATSLRINPKKDDDTQVDCAVVLEQWFVPEGRDETVNTN